MDNQSPPSTSPDIQPKVSSAVTSDETGQSSKFAKLKSYILGDKIILGGLIFLGVIIISGLIALILSPKNPASNLPFVSIPVSSPSDNVTAVLPSPSVIASPSATASPSASPSPSLLPSPSASSSASPSPS